MIRSGTEETVRKITISLPEGLISFTDNKAGAKGMSRSGVIAEALLSLREREMAELAAEGYRFYAGEAKEFASSGLKAVSEVFSNDGQKG